MLKAETRNATIRRFFRRAGQPKTLQDAVRIVVAELLADVSSPPTDLKAVFPRVNVVSCEAEDLPIAGQLRCENGKLKIVYSSYLSPERRRFTIAHEIGHAIIHGTARKTDEGGFQIEQLCDWLAAEILMPSKIVNEIMKGHDLSVRRVLQVARTFRTSISATAKRLHELKKAYIFEIQIDNVTWSTYPRVRKGKVGNLDGVVRPLVEEILNATEVEGEKKIYLEERTHRGNWGLQWLRLSEGKFLFHCSPR